MIIELLMILLFPIVAFIGLYFFLTITRSHRLRIRYNINGRRYVKDYLMKEKTEKRTKDIYWFSNAIWQKKIKVERPPEKCIDVGAKGKYYVEAYSNTEMSDGTLEVTWLRDGVDINETTPLEIDGRTFKDSFKPYSTTQRSFVANQHKKELERKSKVLTFEKILNIAAISIFFLTLIVGFVFGQDIIESLSGYEGAKTRNLEIQNDISNKLLAIVDALDIEVKNYNIQVSQSVGNVASNVITTTNEEQPKEIDYIGKGLLE